VTLLLIQITKQDLENNDQGMQGTFLKGMTVFINNKKRTSSTLKINLTFVTKIKHFINFSISHVVT